MEESRLGAAADALRPVGACLSVASLTCVRSAWLSAKFLGRAKLQREEPTQAPGYGDNQEAQEAYVSKR